MISLNKYLESFEFETDSSSRESILKNIQKLLEENFSDFYLCKILINIIYNHSIYFSFIDNNKIYEFMF